MLLIKIEPIDNNLKATLILKRMHAETVLDQVTGEPDYVMSTVREWLELTENLTTIKNM